MSDESTVPSTEGQPVVAPSFLNEDLSTYDTSLPVVRGNPTTEVEITKVEVVLSAQKEDGSPQLRMLVISTKTTVDHISTKNKPIERGYPLPDQRITLDPLIGRPGKKDRTEEMIKRDVAKFVQSCGQKGGIYPLERFVGLRAMAKLGIEAASGKWPEKNDVTFVIRG